MKGLRKEIGWLLEEKYHSKPTKQFYKDVKRLTRSYEPLDYVIGFTEFLGVKIDLSKKPLIPRPETEFWVHEAIKIIKKTASYNFESFQNCKTRILDIFSGSGCIGLAVLKNFRTARVVFADKDKNSISQIKKNLKINKINPVFSQIVRSDIFGEIEKKRLGKFDYIFANPPYIPIKNRKLIQKSVLKYEPKQALFGGQDGLFYIRKFLSQAKNYLNPGGQIFMEFSPEQKKSIEKILKTLRHGSGRFRGIGYSRFTFHKDQFDKWRWVEIVLS